MYYSAVVQDDCVKSRQVMRIAECFDIDLKTFGPTSFQGSQMLDIAKDEPDFSMPVVMAGDEVIAMGHQAWLMLYEHSLANPHVHWEAGDGEED
jgi:hypothetical protein